MNAPFEAPFKRRSRPRAKTRAVPPYRRKILFEQLEQRLLLSADGASPGIADQLAAALLDSGASQQSYAPSSDASIQSTRSTIPPGVWIDFDPTADSWIIELDAGARALQAGDGDNVWRITGADEGTLNGMPFSEIGILLGGADNEDTFTFEPGGSLSGYLEGGAGGFDTLVIEGGSYQSVVYEPEDAASGWVRLDNNAIRYLGLEPVNDTSVAPEKTVDGSGAADLITIDGGLDPDDPIEVSGPGLETHSVTQPSELLTVIAGDNDAETERHMGRNPGKEAAYQAADLVGADVVFPDFGRAAA